MIYSKDYYKILEISPSATPADIKKSYRRLALQYHPDKNFGNQLYEAKFKEIIEAYKVLSDVRRRDEYNRSMYQYKEFDKKKAEPPISPQTILNQTIDFRRKISMLDPDRMNKLALFQQIQHLLSRNNIGILQRNNDPRLNKKVIEEIMFCSRFLPFAHVERICFQLTAIAGTDNAMYRKIYHFSKVVRMQTVWNKYKVIVAVLLAIALCFAIYFASTNL
ncbi:MAG: DnaJ domain-containing protein [Bacteroidota bacterium]|nr:DnaJ domain-containing protein [Bacteroidota bacterium]